MTNCTFKHFSAHWDVTQACYFDVRLMGVCKSSHLNLLQRDGASFLGQVGAGGKRPGAPWVHGLHPITTWPSLCERAYLLKPATLRRYPDASDRPLAVFHKWEFGIFFVFGRRAHERVLGW